jgi:hypothetical protein
MIAPKFMTEVFYNHKNFLKTQENFLIKSADSLSEDKLSSLSPYMLSSDVWIKLCDEMIKSKDVDKLIVAPRSVEPMVKAPTMFRPGLRDSIFWCIYVAMNGESLYQSQIKTGTNMINLMMNEKRKMSEYFNTNGASLKNSNHKITLATINQIKCNLMTKPVMDSIESLIPCSIYYARPIYVYFEEISSYMVFVGKDYVSDMDGTTPDGTTSDGTTPDGTTPDGTTHLECDPNIILLVAKDGRYALDYEVSNFMKIKDTLFHIQHYEKALLGISNYKTDELREIYKKVFGEEKEMKKPEYYENILVRCAKVI